MRVLHITETLKPHGLERVIQQCCRELTSQGGSPAVLVSTPGHVDEAFRRSFECPVFIAPGEIAYRKFGITSLAGPKEAALAFGKEFAPDVIHGHSTVGFALGLHLARRLQRPLVITYHFTFDPVDQKTTWGAFRDRPFGDFVRWLKRFQTMRRADRVIAVSRAAREEFLATGLFAPDQVVLIENAVEEELWARPALKEDRSLDVAMCGRVGGQKNFGYGVRVFARLENRAARAAILGNGFPEHVDALRRTITEEGVIDRVEFDAQHLPHKEVLGRLAGAKVLFMPSVFEGLSMAALEGLACGAKLVASRIPSFESTFEGVPGVWLVPLDDPEAAARILDDALASDVWPDREALRRRFGLAAQTERLSALYEDARRVRRVP